MAAPIEAQRRGRRIAMNPDELDAFLGEERTCRVASVGHDGAPHVTPLWFVWDDDSLWLNSIVASQRWTNLIRDPRVSVVVDAGVEFMELRGVELEGTVAPVGEVPRPVEGHADPAAAKAEQMWGAKYIGGAPFVSDGRHAWMKMTVAKLASWDFRKIGRG